MTLTEFLLARIDEDEESVTGMPCNCPDDRELPNCPNRIVADCKAKRRLIAGHAELYAIGLAGDERAQVAESAVWTCLATLAAVHHEHPDYRVEWRL